MIPNQDWGMAINKCDEGIVSSHPACSVNHDKLMEHLLWNHAELCTKLCIKDSGSLVVN